jgi:hypothetical protein
VIFTKFNQIKYVEELDDTDESDSETAESDSGIHESMSSKSELQTADLSSPFELLAPNTDPQYENLTDMMYKSFAKEKQDTDIIDKMIKNRWFIFSFNGV